MRMNRNSPRQSPPSEKSAYNASANASASRTRDFSRLNSPTASASTSRNSGSSDALKTSRNREVARNRKNRRSSRWLIAIPAAIIFGVLSAMMTANYAQFRKYQAQADFKAAQWSALHDQYQGLTHRLAFLQLPKGREQVLLEHGYLKGNQRILLFPSDAKNAAAAPKSSTRSTQNDSAIARNSLETAPTLSDKNDGGSVWKRAGRTLSGWMKSLDSAKN